MPWGSMPSTIRLSKCVQWMKQMFAERQRKHCLEMLLLLVIQFPENLKMSVLPQSVIELLHDLLNYKYEQSVH